MNGARRQPSPAPHDGGFSLIELMIALVIVAILAAVALPSYLDSVRKGRRTEAFSAIAAVQQMQERWRSVMSSYANNARLTLAWNTDPPGPPAGLGLSERLASLRYYSVAIAAADPTGYTVTAVAQGAQASDTRCATLAARVVAGGNLGYGAGASVATIDWTDPNRCWAR